MRFLALLLIVLGSLADRTLTAQVPVCTGWNGQLGTMTSTNTCTNDLFTLPIPITYSDGSTRTLNMGSPAATGVCAVQYPNCQKTMVSQPQELPPFPGVNITLATNMSAGSPIHTIWTITNPSIAEQGGCDCTDVNPYGFFGFYTNTPPPRAQEVDYDCP